jgi:RNA polymerase sigma-70 factor (ECF subfamily)
MYELHKSMVYNLALHYVHNSEDAEEITQDVFVKIFQKINQFQNQSELKTWIYRITINQSLDYIKARKSKKRWAFFKSADIDSIDQDALGDFNHPGVALDQKQAIAHIFKQMERLPEKQKTALILLKIEQMNQNEAAAIMDLSAKAVESLFQRAKKNLLALLNQNEES